MHPDSDLQEYASEMNRQVEFPEFMAIMRQAAIEESQTAEWKFDNADDGRDQDLKLDDLINSPIFEKECREMYEKKV